MLPNPPRATPPDTPRELLGAEPRLARGTEPDGAAEVVAVPRDKIGRDQWLGFPPPK